MKPITRRALAATAAVAGYRMGEAALTALNLGRASEDREVVNYSPRQCQFSSIVDGLQAATGASLGQWNLSLIEAKAGPTASVVRNKRTGQSVHPASCRRFPAGGHSTAADIYPHPNRLAIR